MSETNAATTSTTTDMPLPGHQDQRRSFPCRGPSAGAPAFTSIGFIQQRHAVASVGMAALGAGILLSRKGTKPHRIMGRVWTSVAVLASLNAFRMRDANGELTWFHGLAAATVASASTGIFFARKKNITTHKKLMTTALVTAALAGVVAWATPNKTVVKWGPPAASFAAK